MLLWRGRIVERFYRMGASPWHRRGDSKHPRISDTVFLAAYAIWETSPGESLRVEYCIFYCMFIASRLVLFGIKCACALDYVFRQSAREISCGVKGAPFCDAVRPISSMVRKPKPRWQNLSIYHLIGIGRYSQMYPPEVTPDGGGPVTFFNRRVRFF